MKKTSEKVPYAALKAFYASRGISYTQEAKRLNLSVPTFSRKINRSGSDFTRGEIANICGAYGLNANTFFLE